MVSVCQLTVISTQGTLKLIWRCLTVAIYWVLMNIFDWFKLFVMKLTAGASLHKCMKERLKDIYMTGFIAEA